MKKSKIPSLVSILILTLITAFAWLSFSVYRALTIKPAPVVPEEISKPLIPTLDNATIENLKNREFFEDFEIPEIKTRGRSARTVEEELVEEIVSPENPTEENPEQEENPENPTEEPTAPPDEPENI